MKKDRDDLMRRIDTALHAGRASRAVVLARRGLRLNPHDHWMMARLGDANALQSKYSKAIAIYTKGLKLMPACPALLWGRARALLDLSRLRDARSAFLAIRRLGLSRILKGPCSDGRVWTRALLSDTALRLAEIEHRSGHRAAAARWRRRFMAERKLGAKSVYSRTEISRLLEKLR